MKWPWLLLALGSCGGPFAGARLQPVAESQRRALLTINVPSLDRTDTVMRGWPGADPERWPLRELLFALHGVSGEAARAVAGDRPVGVSVALDGQEVVDALAFALRPEVPLREWLESLGEVRARAGPFALVARADQPRPLYGQVPQNLYLHVEGDALLVSGTLRGLLVAGPAASAARANAGVEVSIDAHPRAWPRAGLAAFLGFLRGQTWAAADDLDVVLGTEAASAVLKITAAGAELHWQAPGPAEARPAPALDPAIAGEGAAAIGALDCHAHAIARLPVLSGTCSIAVDTTNEVWSQEASYPLRAGTRPGELCESLAAAIRAGTVPGPHEDGDPPVEKRLFSATDRALGVDRVLGALASPRARHAAAVHGGPALHDRFVVRDGRLLVASGPHADERLDPRPGPLPPDLQQALAAGRGRAGFLFLDLTALWKPWLKAAQVIQSPLADLAARRPALLKDRRPLVITLEPGNTIDATVTLPPPTFSFLLATATVLFAE